MSRAQRVVKAFGFNMRGFTYGFKHLAMTAESILSLGPLSLGPLESFYLMIDRSKSASLFHGRFFSTGEWALPQPGFQLFRAGECRIGGCHRHMRRQDRCRLCGQVFQRRPFCNCQCRRVRQDAPSTVRQCLFPGLYRAGDEIPGHGLRAGGNTVPKLISG